MARKKADLIQRLVRRGEGVQITTVRTPVTDSSGATRNAISIDLSTAQVPDRRYAADGVKVAIDRDMARIFFVQRKPFGDELQSILLIRVSFLGARQFLRAMEGVTREARQYLTKFHIEPSGAVDIKNAPNQTVMLDANIVAAGFSAREACMDFYHVSPQALLAIRNGADMYAEPVVRVILTTANLLSIYDNLDAAKASLPADEMEEEL